MTKDYAELEKRLREAGSTGLDLSPGDPLCREAADAIASLSRELEEALHVADMWEKNYECCDAQYDALKREVLEAIEPFAKLIERQTSYGQPHFGPWNSDEERHVVGASTGDLRRIAELHTRLSSAAAVEDTQP